MNLAAQFGNSERSLFPLSHLQVRRKNFKLGADTGKIYKLENIALSLYSGFVTFSSLKAFAPTKTESVCSRVGIFPSVRIHGMLVDKEYSFANY